LPEDAYPNQVVFEPESPTLQRSRQGAVLYDWPAGGRMPMWASVQPATVQRADSSGRLVQVSLYLVMTAQDPGAQAQDRFRWGERVLIVQGPTKDDGGGGQNFVTETSEAV